LNKSAALFYAGVLFYAIAELTPLNDVVALFPIYGSQYWGFDAASLPPLSSFAYLTDFAKPFFMLAGVVALGCFFLAFAYMRLRPFHNAVLNFIITWSVVLAVPDIIWPLGTPYYEVLKYYFGILSLVLCFVVVLLFLGWREKPIEK
jgi:hypothetical protein